MDHQLSIPMTRKVYPNKEQGHSRRQRSCFLKSWVWSGNRGGFWPPLEVRGLKFSAVIRFGISCSSSCQKLSVWWRRISTDDLNTLTSLAGRFLLRATQLESTTRFRISGPINRHYRCNSQRLIKLKGVDRAMRTFCLRQRRHAIGSMDCSPYPALKVL